MGKRGCDGVYFSPGPQCIRVCERVCERFVNYALPLKWISNLDHLHWSSLATLRWNILAAAAHYVRIFVLTFMVFGQAVFIALLETIHPQNAL